MGRLRPAALATFLGLIGCGTSTISHGEFERRGNAICAATATRVDRLAAPRPVAASRGEVLAGYVDAVVAELRQELADLRQIGFPSGERRRLTEAYNAVEGILNQVERDPQALRAGALATATTRLRDAGLPACRP